MPYKVDGKIACQFPWGAVNYDVKKVIVLDALHPTSGASDERYAANKIYYIPEGVTPSSFSDLQQYRIWHRYWETQKTLVAGNTDVAIEYFNTEEDVTVHHIGIFVAEDPGSTTQCIKIIHESGTVLAQIDADSVSAKTTKYGLEGYLRTAVVNNIVFHKNQKYYIMYTDNRTTSEYHPAYFQEENGNSKAFKNRDSKSIADLNSCAPYLGWISNLNAFIVASEDTIMVWDGDSTLNSGVVYVRNGSCHGSYGGKIGNNENLDQTLLNQILNLDSGTIFLWGGYNFSPSGTDVLKMNQLHQKNSTYSKSDYVGIISTRNELLDPQYSVGEYGIVGTTIWRKKSDVTVDDTMDFDQYSGVRLQVAVLIQKSYDASENKDVMTYGTFWSSQQNGYIYTLKSGYSYDFTIDQNNQLHGYTPSNPPSTWVVNRIYYLEENGNYPGSTWANAGLNCYYEDGQGNPKFEQIAEYGNNLSYVFNIDTQSALNATEEISLAPAIDIIGQISNLVKTSYTGNYISTVCRNTAVDTSPKYYLEVNGDEV